MGWKRPDLALEAVAALPEARLRVVGEPFLAGGRRLLEELRRRAEQPDLAGRVEFAGATDDPAAELAAASCLLHCADAEPFGRVVAEALACGLPVVAPAAGGPAELVDDGCGRLYPPGDAAAAAAALREVRADRPRLAEGARARAEQAVDLADTRRRYRELVPPRPRPEADASLVTVIHDSEPQLRALLASVERPAARARGDRRRLGLGGRRRRGRPRGGRRGGRAGRERGLRPGGQRRAGAGRRAP